MNNCRNMSVSCKFWILTFRSWPPSYDLCRYRCLGGIYSGCPLQIPPFCLPSVVTLGQSIYISELRNPLWSEVNLKAETDKSKEAPVHYFRKHVFYTSIHGLLSMFLYLENHVCAFYSLLIDKP